MALRLITVNYFCKLCVKNANACPFQREDDPVLVTFSR